MSTMEDKELQELFDAKRTVEANRRRQEELRLIIAPTAHAPKSRRLWPVWVLSAAAGLALLLITLPLLFRSETAAPKLVAEAKEIPTSEDVPNTNTTTATSKTRTFRITRASRTSRSTATPEAPLILAEAEEPLPEPVLVTETEEQHPEDTPVAEDSLPTADTPTIHRRTSTQMVCSNCSINNVPSPSTTLQDFLAASFGTATNTPLTLKTINF